MLPLAYSTNLHAAESCADIAHALAAWAGPMRCALGWERLGVDLRLGSLALRGDLAALRTTLDAHGLSAHTLNGFPLRPFQAARVKEDAYLPDWSEGARLDDTLLLLDAALLLSDEPVVTISTSPGSFRPLGEARNRTAAFARALGQWAAAAQRAWQRTGRTVILCPEPEPWCTLETSHEVAAFWREDLAVHGVAAAAAACDGDVAAGRQAVERHLGVCYDTCHLSLAFEDHVEAVARLRGAGVPIVKCQVSAAPEADATDPAQVAALAAMAEPRFLHQSAAAGPGVLVRCQDLDGLAACLGRAPKATTVRSHFHVPIDVQRLGNGLATTAPGSRAGLHACLRAGCRHVAVETYTWPLLAADDVARMRGTMAELQTLARWTSELVEY